MSTVYSFLGAVEIGYLEHSLHLSSFCDVQLSRNARHSGQ